MYEENFLTLVLMPAGYITLLDFILPIAVFYTHLDIKIMPIYFDNSIIHLDCVFNTLEKGAVVISPYVYDKDIIKKYIPKLYEISKDVYKRQE